MSVLATNLGFPRIGLQRELKQALEGFWKGQTTREQLLATAAGLRARHWRLQQEAGSARHWRLQQEAGSARHVRRMQRVYARHGRPALRGLLLGYGTIAENRIEDGLRRLRLALAG